MGLNEGSWFLYVDATQIITGIDSLILIKFAALSNISNQNPEVDLHFSCCLHIDIGTAPVDLTILLPRPDLTFSCLSWAAAK